MPKKWRHKNQQNNKKGRLRIRLRILVFALAVLLSVIPIRDGHYGRQAQAIGCPDLKVLFVRGSGGERYISGHYLAFKASMEAKLATTDLAYEFDDLDYPAVSIDVGDGHLGTLLGAYFGGGEAYEFGESVHKGTAQLLKDVNENRCVDTKYVLAGYSQGAVVILDGLSQIDPSKILYVATFGDPKIYLPEGKGAVPAACAGKNLSEYRIYVPDCRAYKGILGARNPYTTVGYENKIGTWCNKYDVLCSSYFSIKSHTNYAEDGIYEDASRYIFSKIGAEFGISNKYTSPHDTAILIDSTGSMSGLIAKYKAEALRLAEKTFETGGRVALYDYRDLEDGYVPVERCNFETCNVESFKNGLDAIRTDGGGDVPESLLSASLHVMKQLNWKFGSTKSLVILTDAGYHSPDLDGTTFYDVQKLSKQIDPVNFYIITPEVGAYQALAEATGGAVASSVDDLSVLTDTIMERYDSLPRVEEEFEDEVYDNDLPEIVVSEVERIADGSVRVKFVNSGEAAVVILNDGVIGTTYEGEFTITGLRADIENIITLVPLSATRRGEAVVVGLNNAKSIERSETGGVEVPKAPNTGKR